MRVPRMRFTVRSLMIGVAVIALVAGGATQVPVAKHVWKLLDDASRHARDERNSLKSMRAEIEAIRQSSTVAMPPGWARWETATVEQRQQFVEYYRLEATYHAAWKRQYLRAAWHPWGSLPSGPQPPLPPPPPPIEMLPPPPPDEHSPPSSLQRMRSDDPETRKTNIPDEE